MPKTTLSPRTLHRRSTRLQYMMYLSGFGALWCCFFMPLLSMKASLDDASSVRLVDIRRLEAFKRRNTRTSKDTFDKKEPHPSEIPSWLQEYSEWHSAQLRSLNATNWKTDHKFLVMRCLTVDDRCGGAADRLKSIPAALLLAHELQRIFFIKWERPARLEEFLIPASAVSSTSTAALNWSIPSWLDEQWHFAKRPMIIQEKHFRQVRNHPTDTTTVVDMRFQSSDHGASFYNSHREIRGQSQQHDDFQHVYRAVWNHVFQPSPAVAALIHKQTQRMLLERNNRNTANHNSNHNNDFVAVHVRSKYRSDKANQPALMANAINCASQLAPGMPIYLATDSLQATTLGLQYAQARGIRVVAQDDDDHDDDDHRETLHLDRGTDFFTNSPSGGNTPFSNNTNTTFPPSAYYNIFVDFYMIAQSKCVAVNKGGFGRWAYLLSEGNSSNNSNNNTCLINHGKQHCDWVNLSRQ